MRRLRHSATSTVTKTDARGSLVERIPAAAANVQRIAAEAGVAIH